MLGTQAQNRVAIFRIIESNTFHRSGQYVHKNKYTRHVVCDGGDSIQTIFAAPLNLKHLPLLGDVSISGEGGIRTREPLWVTRFPSVRAKPDYATSPVSSDGIIPEFI